MADLNITLSPEETELIDTLMQSGEFDSREQLVIRGLELLKERLKTRDEARAKLDAWIEAGEAAIERGEVVDLETLETRLRARHAARMREIESELQRTG